MRPGDRGDRHRDLAREQLGWGSTADWLTHLAGIRHGQGKQAVEHAHELVERTARDPRRACGGTDQPGASGRRTRCGRSAARRPADPRARRAGAARPGGTTDRDRAAATRAGRDPGDRPRRHRAAVREPQLAREDRVAHRRRFLSITDDGAGGISVKGRGSVEDGATLRAALLPLTAPVPMVDPETCEQVPDPRDYGVRMWDALDPAGADVARRQPAAELARRPPSGRSHDRSRDVCAASWPSVGAPRTASSSRPLPCAGWPAMRTSSRSRSAARGWCSMSAAPTAW